MRIKSYIVIVLTITTLFSCTKEYNCTDLQIQPAFIQFASSDIDTFVLRKFKTGDNFQTLIDTVIVKYGYNGYYQAINDTTSVFVTDGKNGIKAGFDWQIFIPAKNKTSFVSDIVSEKKTGKTGYGIFSMDPAPGCTNKIFSVKMDNHTINFSNSDTASHYLYIRN
jgi:hypothetical protein